MKNVLQTLYMTRKRCKTLALLRSPNVHFFKQKVTPTSKLTKMPTPSVNLHKRCSIKNEKSKRCQLWIPMKTKTTILQWFSSELMKIPCAIKARLCCNSDSLGKCQREEIVDWSFHNECFLNKVLLWRALKNTSLNMPVSMNHCLILLSEEVNNTKTIFRRLWCRNKVLLTISLRSMNILLWKNMSSVDPRRTHFKIKTSHHCNRRKIRNSECPQCLTNSKTF
jgi:hypothetical protein